jgi:hypothetical protein
MPLRHAQPRPNAKDLKCPNERLGLGPHCCYIVLFTTTKQKRKGYLLDALNFDQDHQDDSGELIMLFFECLISFSMGGVLTKTLSSSR